MSFGGRAEGAGHESDNSLRRQTRGGDRPGPYMLGDELVLGEAINVGRMPPRSGSNGWFVDGTETLTKTIICSPQGC